MFAPIDDCLLWEACSYGGVCLSYYSRLSPRDAVQPHNRHRKINKGIGNVVFWFSVNARQLGVGSWNVFGKVSFLKETQWCFVPFSICFFLESYWETTTWDNFRIQKKTQGLFNLIIWWWISDSAWWTGSDLYYVGREICLFQKGKCCLYPALYKNFGSSISHNASQYRLLLDPSPAS